MYILGTTYDMWITTVTLLKDGKIIAACPEERLNRIKCCRDFPIKAVQYCLKEAGITVEDLDAIAFGWNPGFHVSHYNARFSHTQRWRGEYLYTVPNHFSRLFEQEYERIVTSFLLEKSKKTIPIHYIPHHLCHAASAYYLSPFEESAILTSDGRGEIDTNWFGYAKQNEITELKTDKFPHSIGLFYSVITQFLGFAPHVDEWKVMALASYQHQNGENNSYLQKLEKILTFEENGSVSFDLNYFDYYLHDRPTFYNQNFIDVFGPPRTKGEPLTERHQKLAYAVQYLCEKSLAHMLNWLSEETKIPNIVVCGGTFMNSVFNGKILEKTSFKNSWIPSAPDDSGTSMGAALYTYYDVFKGKNRYVQTHNYFGPGYSENEIEKTLKDYKIKYKKVDDIGRYVAGKISEGSLVGWFQGRMEFGQRALGNRSILADPRDPNMKDKINLSIKYREAFRPFAPSIMAEHAEEYFEMPKGTRVPFMEKVYPIKEEKRSEIPAVTHIDGTGRLQTVEKDVNPVYYNLINEFYKLTNTPIILNTSLNINGEPIVCSPTDAIRAFYSCGLDLLVLGNFVAEKS